MKRILTCLLALLIITGCFSSCARRSERDGVTVVCTSFVSYDWAREIVGDTDAVSLHLLVDGGRDMHSFEPSAADMVKILESDLFIYIGGPSEAWVEDLVQKNELNNTLSLLGCLNGNVKYIEHDEGDGHEHLVMDEHVWLSVTNAIFFSAAIGEKLCRIDPANQAIYEKNLDRYLGELSSLAGEYAWLGTTPNEKTLVIADRYPFRYMLEDNGFSVVAAFSGCSAESEASFATVISLAKVVDEQGLSGVLVTETSDMRLAKTVIESTAAKTAEIYTLHSLQSVLDPEHTSYLAVMRDNLEVLRTVLN